jgi:hypothetical protein
LLGIDVSPVDCGRPELDAELAPPSTDEPNTARLADFSRALRFRFEEFSVNLDNVFTGVLFLAGVKQSCYRRQDLRCLETTQLCIEECLYEYA